MREERTERKRETERAGRNGNKIGITNRMK
jgi:hypothetical protein